MNYLEKMSEINNNIKYGYLSFFGYSNDNELSCEVCGCFNSKLLVIDNDEPVAFINDIISLDDKCISQYHNKKQWKDWLKKLHAIKMSEVKK